MTAFHPTCHRLLDKELSGLLETMLAGEVVQDRAIVERLVRFLGAAVSLHERHDVDRRGRCMRCGPRRRWWRPWHRRHSCSVYSALRFCLGQPFRFVLPAVLDRAGGSGVQTVELPRVERSQRPGGTNER
jgi:hypothetical protein